MIDTMSISKPPRWTNPDFGSRSPTPEPPRAYTNTLRWMSQHRFGLTVGTLGLGTLAYLGSNLVGAMQPQSYNQPTTMPTSTASTPEQPSAPASPTDTPTSTAESSKVPSSSGYPNVSDLLGNVGYYAPDENDKSAGVIWGRAITRKDTVNFIKIACKGNVVTAGLAVVNGDNEVVKRYKASKYPKIIPKPCSDGEVVTAVRDTPFEYYSVLLGRIITKGTIGR